MMNGIMNGVRLALLALSVNGVMESNKAMIDNANNASLTPPDGKRMFCGIKSGLHYPVAACLDFVEAGVFAVLPHQFGMGSLLNDPPLVHDQDLVRHPHR